MSPDLGGGRGRAAVPGYALGSPRLPRAPFDVQELERLKATMGWTAEDDEALLASRDVLRPHLADLVAAWFDLFREQPHLLAAFEDRDTGEPIPAYLDAVRQRFEQWVLDTASPPYDQAWLDYQLEVGRRHHREGKNRTDIVRAAPHVPWRYVLASYEPVVATLRPFLARGRDAPEDVDRMHAAWRKAILLQLVLWSRPYVKDDDW